MKLDSIYDDLIYGELSAHAITMDGTISAPNKLRIISHINVALMELYSKFPLLMKELTLIQDEGLTEYPLKIEHATSNPTSGYPKYIKDSLEHPFLGDVIRVDSVFDEVGDKVLVNAISPLKAVFTPDPQTIEIPSPTDTNALFVIYRAKHPTVDTTTKELLLPENFRPALLAYIAYRVYSGGTAPEHATISAAMYSKYSMFVTAQEEYGLVNKDIIDLNYKPVMGGWV